ncbi:MAG: 5-oxoprolinase subunit PxpA [Phycisphaerales bacterium]
MTSGFAQHSRGIDLNCDMGERPGAEGVAGDIRLMEYVSSVNIACGGHAGGATTIRAVAGAARARGLSVGAHPGYPDPGNFGRARVEMLPGDLRASLVFQMRLLKEHAGGRVTHVKPHGALYHDVMADDGIAAVFVEAASAVWFEGRLPVLVALAGSRRASQWRAEGLAVAAEAFAERRYRSDGSLTARGEQGAVIDDAEVAAQQTVDIAVHRCVATGGGLAPVMAETICIHSDSPGAEAIAARVRAALTSEGVPVRGIAALP